LKTVFKFSNSPLRKILISALASILIFTGLRSAHGFATIAWASGGATTWTADDTGVLISAGNSATVKYTVDAAAAKEALSVIDTYGLITGYYGAKYTQTATAATSIASFTAPATEVAFTYQLVPYDDDTTYSQTLTGTTPTATTTTITPSSLRAVGGSALTFTANTVDQFGVAVSGATIAWSVSGQNVVASTNKVTDADGNTSFTYTPGTSAGTDTLSATGSGSATVSVVSDLGVGSVLLTSPNTDATGVVETSKTYTDIDASASGASNTVASVVATVKDAAGNLLAGVPVTFSITGPNAAVLSTTKTLYTVAGKATASVYAWTAGTYTVTATAGGKSSTAPVNFAQSTATEARNITATVKGNIITAKVTDRFGNGVYNVAVYATRVGTGNFGGASKTNSTTDRNGEVEFILNDGTATVTLSVDTTADYGQTSAGAGLVSTKTATDIFTAYTAGTASTAEAGVGASIAPAGTNSVSVDVSSGTGSSDAVDAANEATDAANAATDAANAAAEAADAATAAAQDAQAAVAALASQVADLIAGIKAQITALTNLVIKIQKKVKA